MMGSVRELSDAPITSKESTSQVSYVAVVAFGDLRPARLWTRVDEVDVRGRRGARVATLPRRRAYACFDVRRRDAQSISGSLGRQMLLLCSVIRGSARYRASEPAKTRLGRLMYTVAPGILTGNSRPMTRVEK